MRLYAVTCATLHILAALSASAATALSPPSPARRCAWVTGQISAHARNLTEKLRCEAFHLQATDSNFFYRGVDFLYWHDFAVGGWSTVGLADYAGKHHPVTRTSGWTWITGDQHLSNFGAWMNRNEEVQFGANDFDEAVIQDFHFDVHRVATSIYDHAITNGFGDKDAAAAVTTFATAYLSTIASYVGNDDELLFELTEDNAKGELKDFLEKVRSENSKEEELRKFTNVTADGRRVFVFNNKTRLQPLSDDIRQQILNQWTDIGYGRTLEKVGFHTQEFDKEFFRIIDFAKRVGSGDGSYGVPRYYLLINGTDKYANSSLNNVYAS